ncbi:MAG: homoserine dehydrogenase, partial [Hyphomicrobium sp.]
MQQPLTLGIAGLGTVGAGLLRLLKHHKDRLEERAGRPIRIGGVSARSKGKKRGADLGQVSWFDDPVKLATDPSIDVFVELIGGSGGVANAA